MKIHSTRRPDALASSGFAAEFANRPGFDLQQERTACPAMQVRRVTGQPVSAARSKAH